MGFALSLTFVGMGCFECLLFFCCQGSAAIKIQSLPFIKDSKILLRAWKCENNFLLGADNEAARGSGESGVQKVWQV